MTEFSPEALDTQRGLNALVSDVRPMGDCEIINGRCTLYGVLPAACLEVCDAARFVEESVALVEARRSQNG